MQSFKSFIAEAKKHPEIEDSHEGLHAHMARYFNGMTHIGKGVPVEKAGGGVMHLRGLMSGSTEHKDAITRMRTRDASRFHAHLEKKGWHAEYRGGDGWGRGANIHFTHPKYKHGISSELGWRGERELTTHETRKGVNEESFGKGLLKAFIDPNRHVRAIKKLTSDLEKSLNAKPSLSSAIKKAAAETKDEKPSKKDKAGRRESASRVRILQRQPKGWQRG